MSQTPYTVAVTPAPRTVELDAEGLQHMIAQSLHAGKDPGFFKDVLAQVESRQARLDGIRAHGASDVLDTFLASAYKSEPAEQIRVPQLAPKPRSGLER